MPSRSNDWSEKRPSGIITHQKKKETKKKQTNKQTNKQTDKQKQNKTQKRRQNDPSELKKKKKS